MKKEVIIAILVGLFFGLVITFGVHQARQTITDDTTTKQVEKTDDGETGQDDSKLALHSPESETIQSDESISVTGTTLPDIFVVIFVNDEETITTSDGSGNFSVDVDLEDGSNVIGVFAVDEDGNTITKERTVIVTSEPLNSDGSLTEDTEASDSADTEDTEEDEE